MNADLFREDLILLLFLGTVGTVFSYGVRALVQLAKKQQLRLLDQAMLCLSAFGLGCIVYSFIEPFFLDVTQTNITTGKIPQGTEFTIVQLSDLHCDGVKRVEEKIVPIVADIHPDLIVFTGDATNNRAGVKDFKTCITALAKIAPTYAVNGNHDTIHKDNDRFFGGTGVQLLVGKSQTQAIRGSSIWVGGNDPTYGTLNLDVLKSAPKDKFTVYLHHYPKPIVAAQSAGIDLYLCGHTHGGQVRLPFYGALTTASDTGKAYEAGYYKVGNTSMYVNRGIGMTGLPLRFMAMPEISVLHIIGTKR